MDIFSLSIPVESFTASFTEIPPNYIAWFPLTQGCIVSPTALGLVVVLG